MFFKRSAASFLMLFITLTDSFAMDSVEQEAYRTDKQNNIQLFTASKKQKNHLFFKKHAFNDHLDYSEWNYKFIRNLDFSADFFQMRGKKINAHSRIITPLWIDKKQQSTFFLAPGITYYQQRLTYNIGLGSRHLNSDKAFLWGINVFYDYDKKGRNSRLSEGVELSWLYISLYGNLYHGLNGWHSVGENHQQQEKPASGYDIKLRLIMPFYPQAAFAMHYFSWKGQKINLFKDHIYRNSPNGINYSIEYRPIPLLGFSVNHAVARQKRRKANTTFTTNVTYDFSRPLAEQITFSSKPAKIDLSQQLFRHVEREYGIILNTREQQPAKQPAIFLSPSIPVIEQQAVILSAHINNYGHKVFAYQWSAPSLALHQSNTSSLIVVAPTHTAGNSNSYPVKLTVFYANGQTVSAQTVLVVQSLANVTGVRRYDSHQPISSNATQNFMARFVTPPAQQTLTNTPQAPPLPASSTPGAPPPPPPPPPPVQAPAPFLQFKKRVGQSNNSPGKKRTHAHDQIMNEMAQKMKEKNENNKSDRLQALISGEEKNK